MTFNLYFLNYQWDWSSFISAFYASSEHCLVMELACPTVVFSLLLHKGCLCITILILWLPSAWRFPLPIRDHLFTFRMVTLGSHTFLALRESNLSIFSAIPCPFCVLLKKTFSTLKFIIRIVPYIFLKEVLNFFHV